MSLFKVINLKKKTSFEYGIIQKAVPVNPWARIWWIKNDNFQLKKGTPVGANVEKKSFSIIKKGTPVDIWISKSAKSIEMIFFVGGGITWNLNYIYLFKKDRSPSV